MRVVVAVALLAAAPALAWEAMCRDTSRVDPGGYRLSDQKLEKAICEDESVDNCEGMAFARGVQLGEHAWLTREAMKLAGLSQAFTDEAHTFEIPELHAQNVARQGYFTNGKALINPALDSLEPAGPSLMNVFQTREVAIPELAEVPDWAHSLAEFALGNEHCIPRGVKRLTAEDVDLCHGFRKGHQGSINSNHWPPLSREVYRRFHGLAMQIAGRCREMESMVPADPSPVAAHMRKLVLACQRESIAMQAYAAHFAEDAFATGHMFMRWGPPKFGRSDLENFRSSEGAAVTGMIHGGRALTHNHDRANLPGPGDPVSGDHDDVRFKLHPSESTLYPGGGDMYLRPCLQKVDGWNVSEGANLTTQRTQMMTCVAAGFREVYEAGPMSRAPLGPAMGLGTLPAAGSLSDACWSQRLTNKSMMLSLAVQKWVWPDASDFAHPGVFTNLVPIMALRFQRSDRQLDIDGQNLAREIVRMRAALIDLGYQYTKRAAEAPNDTDVAEMTGDSEWLKDIFGTVGRDGPPALPWSGVYLAELADGGIPFYEAPVQSRWVTPLDSPACATDDNCMDGHYCDQSALESGTGRKRPRCVRHETAIARAFRAGETMYLCRSESQEDLTAVRAACKASGMAGSQACRACVQVVAPRVRNGCDPGTVWSTQPRGANGEDTQAICDHYNAYNPNDFKSMFVHVPYVREGSETWDDAFARVTLAACLNGPDGDGGVPRAIAYNFNLTLDAGSVFVGQSPYTTFKATCGKGLGTHVHGYNAANPSMTSTVTYNIALRPQVLTAGVIPFPFEGPAEGLELTLFEGAGCDTSGTGTQATLQGDAGVWRMTWSVPPLTTKSMCLRVRARGETVRTGYALSVGESTLF